MALSNLGLISKTLLNVLNLRIRASSDWPTGGLPDGGAALITSPAPPDLVSEERAVSLYLYHLREDAHTKSQDWEIANVDIPQQFKPMGLTLYYVLCPRSNLGDVIERTLAEQLIMGLAVKALHDFPLIDDSTRVLDRSGVLQTVLDSKLRNRKNRIRVTMQPTPYTEASQFWNAGSQPLRMAAYFEVSATLLEPEIPPSGRQRVALLGVHPLLRGQPVIEATRNQISFTIPGEFDARQAECSPAEVTLGQSMEIVGIDLKGDSNAVLLSHPDFAEALVLDAGWLVQSNENHISLTVQDQVVTSSGNQAIVPGSYGISVRTTARRSLPDGTQRDFDQYSNESAFAITPKISSISALAADLSGNITVAGFLPASLGNGAVSLFCGADKLQRVASGPLQPGQFLLNAAPSQVIDFRLPTSAPSKAVLPLRLVVRGAEAAPNWVSVP